MMFTLEQFYEEQDRHVEIAKRKLKATKRCNPWAFIYTTAEDWKRASGDTPYLSLNDQHLDDGAPKSMSVVMIDMAPVPELLTVYIRSAWPERAHAIDDLLKVAKEVGVGDPHKHIKNAFEHLGYDTKDITSELVRRLAQDSHASGVIFISEAWQCKNMTEEMRKEYGSVKDMPGSFEVISSVLETRSAQRLVSVPVRRKPSHKGRDMGRVLGFGAKDVLVLGEGMEKLSGRMASWLKPFDA